MQKSEKILEEIRKAFEKNTEDIADEDGCHHFVVDGCTATYLVNQIIRKHMNDGWIPVEERLPEEKANPVSQDFYEYQVTAKFGNVKDVRHYKYGNGHWWHGPGIVDQYVLAWRENPEPYRPEQPEACKYTGGSCCYPIDQCSDCPKNPERDKA